MIGGPASDSADGLFTRDRSDDPVEVHLTVKLRDGRTVEVELAKGVRPKVDLTVDRREPDDLWLGFGASRMLRLAHDSVRIVIEADTRDGCAEDDGCLFRFAVRKSEGAEV